MPLKIWMASLVLLGPFSLAAQPLAFPEIEARIDGVLSEWPTSVLAVVAPGEQGTEVGQGSGRTADDLRIEVRGGWDSTYLYLGLVWVDDQIDVARIPEDSAVWLDPGGNRRDRMYYYDNIQIRLRTLSGSLAAWLSPQPDPPLQWSRFDPTAGERIFNTFPSASGITESGVVIELAIPWGQLGAQPSPGFEFDLHFVAPDSDQPGVPLEMKEQGLYWLQWHATVRLSTQGKGSP